MEEEKRLPPTPRRIARARKEGFVPKSTELTVALLYLFAIFIFFMMRKTLLFDTMKFVTFSLSEAGRFSLTPQNFLALCRFLSGKIFLVILPIAAAMMVIGISANLMQSGFVLATSRLRPRLSVLNPVAGFKRLFSKDGFVRALMGIFKMIIVGAVGYFTIKSKIAGILSSAQFGILDGLAFSGKVAFELAIKLGLFYLILAVFDFAYQKYRWKKQLMMTPWEYKEEMKAYEGDPRVKRKRYQEHLKISRQRMLKAVEKADVVITNPVLIAVALKYEPEKMSAPVVVAKGMRKLAEKIREIAQKHGVPIVRNPELARLLYRMVDVGEEIPVKLYQAVAEVLAYVYRLKGRTEL